MASPDVGGSFEGKNEDIFTLLKTLLPLIHPNMWMAPYAGRAFQPCLDLCPPQLKFGPLPFLTEHKGNKASACGTGVRT